MNNNTTQKGAITKNNYATALYALTTLFFMWGFITVLNDILIPHLKSLFELNYTETMLIQFTFFGAYFIVSLPAGSLMRKIGYQKGIVTGLAITGLGALLFYPASVIITYPLFLLAFFTLASGITILQVAANPFVAILGSPETASSRLNLTQGFNSLGTTIAPLLGAYLILNETANAVQKAEAVQLPYIGIAIVLFLIAGYFLYIKLPVIEPESYKESAGSAWSYRHLVYGAIAIFLYVGGEVSIGSFLVSYLGEPYIAGFAESEAAKYVAIYWGGAMIGRFLGAIMLSDQSKMKNKYLYIAFIITGSFFLGWYSTGEATLGAIFLGLSILNFAAFTLGKNNPSRTLWVFSAIAVVALAVTMLASGWISVWSVVCIGLFNSIMFPTIFTLAIDGLGEHTSQASGILCASIVGGALIPLLQGFLADNIGIHYAFVIPVFCYLYIMFYGIKGYKHNLGNA